MKIKKKKMKNIIIVLIVGLMFSCSKKNDPKPINKNEGAIEAFIQTGIYINQSYKSKDSVIVLNNNDTSFIVRYTTDITEPIDTAGIKQYPVIHHYSGIIKFNKKEGVVDYYNNYAIYINNNFKIEYGLNTCGCQNELNFYYKNLNCISNPLKPY